MSVIKTPEEVEKMRISGALLSRCLDMLIAIAKPGITSQYVNDIADEFIRDHGAIPAFKNYQGGGACPFPASICFSRNSVLVHGVPSPDEVTQLRSSKLWNAFESSPALDRRVCPSVICQK